VPVILGMSAREVAEGTPIGAGRDYVEHDEEAHGPKRRDSQLRDGGGTDPERRVSRGTELRDLTLTHFDE
jgi:hypothetical protein